MGSDLQYITMSKRLLSSTYKELLKIKKKNNEETNAIFQKKCKCTRNIKRHPTSVIIINMY